MDVLLKDSPIKAYLAADQKTSLQPAHIFVGSIRAARNKIESKELDCSKIKMVIFDEFDEILKNANNKEDLQQIITKCFKEININPMYVLFSATIDEQTEKDVQIFIN
jgi:superfamily II DNA/RNA helicase